MLKKLVLFVAAVMLLASSAQAAVNDVEVKTDVTDIVLGSCDQSGVITFTFDNGTVLSPAQHSILVKLPKDVTICKPIDLYVATADGTQTADASGPIQGNYIASGDSLLHVKSNAEGSTIVIKAVNGVIQANNTGMRLSLFDGSNATDELLDGSKAVWNATATQFDVNPGVSNFNATGLVNTMCINAAASYPALDVKVYLESVGDTAVKKYSFNPSEPVVAKLGSRSFSLLTFKTTRTAEIGNAQADCSIDYEGASGFCPTPTAGFVALETGAAEFGANTYRVELEVLVNGNAGDHGVYFAGGTDLGFGDKASVGTIPMLGGGVESMLLADAKNAAGFPTGCVFPDDRKVVKVVRDGVVVADAAQKGKKVLRVKMPALMYDKNAVAAGERVSVRVTVKKGACLTLINDTQELFTFVKECGAAKPAGVLLFPYFADAPFWNGMALTNIDATPVNASLAIVDEKGGKGSIDIEVPANGMYVNLVEKIIADSAFNGTVDAKKRCYIIVTPQSGSLTGFAMMGNAGESMGYTVNN